ncbi:MAG: FAD-binding oxidoreductase [Chloroflexi bacterium]|nr:FAD-binding oxidoreductase [Chloroflexota bacterium]
MEGRLAAPDVLIVGAGVVGAALAYECARRGQRVLVVDRAEAGGQGATRWSMGGTHWLAGAADDRLRDFCREGLARHQQLTEELGTPSGFYARPIVVLAPDETALDNLAGLVANGETHGFVGRMVGRDELYALEPTLRPGAAVGAAVCSLGWLDTITATQAWLQGARMHGAQIRTGVDVRALHLEGASPAVETSDGTLSAGQVLLTAGAWTARLLQGCGIALPLHHTHAEIVEIEPRPEQYRHVVIASLPMERTRAALELAMCRPEHAAQFAAGDGSELPIPPSAELGVVQMPDGRVRLGQMSRAVSGFWDGPHPDAEQLIRAEVAKFYPELAQQPGTLSHRPVSFSADRLPLAGPVPGAPGTWLVSGLVSPLIYLPALAPRVAAALAGDSVPEIALFSPGRLMASA